MLVRLGSILVSTCAFGLVATAVYAEKQTARVAPAFRLGCERIAPDRVQVRNLGHSLVPGGTMVLVEAGGAHGGGQLHADLRPGDLWSPVWKPPAGFTACEASAGPSPTSASREGTDPKRR